MAGITVRARRQVVIKDFIRGKEFFGNSGVFS